jgi:cell division septation protein DedD
MDYNSLVVDQSDFEDACDQLIVAIKILKRSVRPPEATAPAEAPPKKVKAKKAAPTPEPTPEPSPEPTPEPSAEAHAAFKKTIVAYATAHGKAASLEKLKSMGFSAFTEVPPQSYDAVAAAFAE